MDKTCDKEMGKLYVVATPIGNLEDMTFRAVRILGEVNMIAAEDTRHTAGLLAHYKIMTSLISYHEYNERERTPELIDCMKSGKSVALVSNAGTPLVSDPGHVLVRQAVANGIPVIPIPGVSAAITAMSVSDLPSDSFVFIGFPPRKEGKRKQWFKMLAEENRTIIMYESPKRILRTIRELIETLGDRKAMLAREITKMHEEYLRDSLSGLLNNLNTRPTIKGECTLLIGGSLPGDSVSLGHIREQLAERVAQGEKLTTSARELAQKTGWSKREIYEIGLTLKKGNSNHE